MKNFILFAAIVLVTASCTKNSEQLNTSSEQPSVISHRFFKVAAGSNESVACDVTLNIPDESKVSKVEMWNWSARQMRWESFSPKSGVYRMYDHVIGDYPSYGEQIYYYWVFKMKDGTEITTDKTQCY
jgi:hypothetical protein